MQDMRVGCVLAAGDDKGDESTLLEIREDKGMIVAAEGGTITADDGRLAATGQGSKALGTGVDGGKEYGKTVVFPGIRTGLKVLPVGDHMKAIFVPKGSGASGGSPR